jgi:hypothetical protein
MKTTMGLLAAFTCLTATAQAQNIELQPHTVRDPVAVNQDAVTFLKPKGWAVSGGVKWYLELSHQACVEVKIANPKGLEQIETLPWCTFTYITNPVFPLKTGSNYLGNIVHYPVDDPREAVKQFTIPLVRAKYNPKIVGYVNMPEVAKSLSAMHGGASVKSGKVRLEYALDGKMVEEDIYLSIFVTSAPIGGNSRSYIWGPAWPPFSLRAEKGKLDEQTPLMLAVVNSTVINPKWFGEVVYVQKLFQERIRQGTANAAKLSETIRKNGDAIFKMSSESYWKQQASQDRIHRNFSDYIRGVTRYQSPTNSGQTIQLPNTHQYAWSSPSGGYILSNDPNYNPNQGSTYSWQLLKQAK